VTILESFTDTVREILYMRYKERKIEPLESWVADRRDADERRDAAYIYYYGEQWFPSTLCVQFILKELCL